MPEQIIVEIPPEESKPEDGKESGDKEKRQKYTIEVILDPNEDAFRQVCEIEKESFPEKVQSSPEDLKEVLENKDGIHLFIKDEAGEIAGNILSLRQNQEYKDLKKFDPDITNDKDALYVESVAIRPQKQGMAAFKNAWQALVEEAKSQHYKKIAMHARVSTGFSEALQKRYNAKFVRRLQNWYNFGEPFDYLEIEIPEDNIEKQK
ncbi:MAG: GNAT family N-acetyltransferase [Candidatus Portnoybacteria bacterium]|nr:GNAT family N-acetyltransferase [Candidatus Portnoybacteria bacterium]